ncbi:alpha-glucan phosphorylase [delta proteobacterium NaphS2]|nr:alpha-glucan phosphorylase [delta proteobacterium NaphS2]
MNSPVATEEPRRVEEFDELMEIANNLRWSWDRGADDIWRSLDPELWDLTRNPRLILQSIASEKVEKLAGDAEFRERVEKLAGELREAGASVSWFQEKYGNTPLTSIAYFSMEFMLGEALPIYSGGLGNVAGDQLKAASDLGVPVTGIGLLYQQGYFRQMITPDGSQEAFYPINDPGQLPITPARDGEGKWVRFQVPLPNYPIWVRVWQAQVGRVRLYLLDSNDPANPPLASGITAQLYGGGPETRIAQEFILGVGGWGLLRHLGLAPEVCHLNEGHAAFVVLERAADFMETTGCPFQVALQATRAGNLFTTHTPVAAGFDCFPADLMHRYLDVYARDRLGVSPGDLMALGRENPADENAPFNMTYLAVRGSGAVNGVSQLHGQVSRRIFQSIFPRWPSHEVPVGHVTNGIHAATWDSRVSDALWTKYGGKARWLGETEQLEEAIGQAPDEELWTMRQTSRRALVTYARDRYARQTAMWGAAPDAVGQARQVLDPETLTLGFARRFATYKRPTLLLRDPERLIRLLTDPERPMQLIVAGKAHPADRAGQEMIRQWIAFTARPEVRGRVIFLSDYDMLLTEQLVCGVDVWLNTPRRPWEACGTSGMKVLANGGLNLSELDGWWAEAYGSEVGWAIGDGREHGDDPAWDTAEADVLYALLEEEVAPQFYGRDKHGIPVQWLDKVRESMVTLTARFSSNRAVREYTESYYLPAAAAFEQRRADNAWLGRQLVDWQTRIYAHWSGLQFGHVEINSSDAGHEFQVHVVLGRLKPEDIVVELYAEPLTQGERTTWPMARRKDLTGPNAGIVCRARVPSGRPAAHYTARIVPAHAGASIPLEAPLILWQR